MASSFLRPAFGRTVLRTGKQAAFAPTIFVRGKATLPALAYDYGALEPSISGKIMELHHSKHHQTYVNSYNDATEKMAVADASDDPAARIALQPLINFHGGGHVNHSLFWENLAPKSSGGGEPPSGALATAIEQSYGGLDGMKTKFNAALAGIQGSGWAWLVKDTQTGSLSIKTYAVRTPVGLPIIGTSVCHGPLDLLLLQNQDPVIGQFKPILGVDAWEHAYYLQYQNRKAEYFSAIWDVINWKAAEKRFS